MTATPDTFNTRDFDVKVAQVHRRLRLAGIPAAEAIAKLAEANGMRAEEIGRAVGRGVGLMGASRD